MNYVMEYFYNLLETVIIVCFINMYFGTKPRFSKKIDIMISIVLIFAEVNFITIFDLSWITTLFMHSIFFTCLFNLFYKGTLLEHLLIAIIMNLILALIGVSVITIMSRLLGVEYSALVNKSSLSRFFTVLIGHLIYTIILSVILSFKKKYALMLHNTEFIMISATLVVSGILISIVRNVIYNTKEHYNAFLIILLCILLLNIGQYYTMIYISKKNISEKNISLMRKQIEMQEKSLHNLEEKYDETAKIRHDMKNYVACALKLAEQGDNKDLIDYLKELSEDKINTITSYVLTQRKILGAVINSKLGIAECKGFDMQCVILNELDNIKDLDIGILLANLLDNAIEACEKNKDSSEIMLKTWSEAGYYCIELSNTVEIDVFGKNPDLLTTKPDKSLHGVGLRSVKDIVGKYNGILNFQQRNNKFYVYISLMKDIVR